MKLTNHPCWLTPDGEVIPTPNWGDHAYEARQRFPDAGDPDDAAIRAGWLKIFRDGMITGRPLTHLQRQMLESCGEDPDAMEDDAYGTFRYMESMRSRR